MKEPERKIKIWRVKVEWFESDLQAWSLTFHRGGLVCYPLKLLKPINRFVRTLTWLSTF